LNKTDEVIADRIRDASRILADMGMDRERSNERTALVFLALLELGPRAAWSDAEAPLLGTRAIMDWMRNEYSKDYAPNSRETIRRFTLHQLVHAGLVRENQDQPDRPVNSPYWNYQITPSGLAVARSFGTPSYEPTLAAYVRDTPGLVTQWAKERSMQRIPVTLPGGKTLTLSPGGQNTLIKAMVEDFCSLFTPNGIVVYIGDADTKWAVFETDYLEALGVTVDQHGKMPDLVVHLPDQHWLVLLEAASSHGPVDAGRHAQLSTLFAGCTAGLVFVSCFPDRAEMRKYLSDIAWESEVWCADSPTHLIHFNGSRFLGPYLPQDSA
jgi:type II restriction enzyme